MTSSWHIRKILIIFFLIGFLVFALAMLRTESRTSSGKTRIITDMVGNKIKVADPLTRIALFGGPTGQLAYILGARDQLCAVTNTLKGSELLLAFDPSITKLPGPRSTSGHINIEELLLANPQLVIAGNLDGSIVQKKTSIPVAFTESSMNHDTSLLKDEIRFYASVFQKEARGEKYIAYLEKTLAFVKSRTGDIPKDQRKKVFNGYGPKHLVTLGGDTFMHERIATAGCLDATAGISTAGTKEGLHSGLSEMSMEKVLGWNPDIMVIDTGTPEEIYNDPRWKNVAAIRKRQVYKQPVGIFIWDRPTAEAAVLYPLWLAKTAYPDLFADVDLVSEVKNFYRETMTFDLSDAQARAVLNGDYGFRFGAVKGKR
ncbi:MAG TPA: ABC transporter substrate-binding protein [Geobacteraceae bacterium]|nr:ABC transporter substrate-binding protein [Geobacteraceae bacterium]